MVIGEFSLYKYNTIRRGDRFQTEEKFWRLAAIGWERRFIKLRRGKKLSIREYCYFCDGGGGYTGSSERRAGALWMKKAAFAASGLSGRFRQPLVRRFFLAADTAEGMQTAFTDFSSQPSI